MSPPHTHTTFNEHTCIKQHNSNNVSSKACLEIHIRVEDYDTNVRMTWLILYMNLKLNAISELKYKLISANEISIKHVFNSGIAFNFNLYPRQPTSSKKHKHSNSYFANFT